MSFRITLLDQYWISGSHTPDGAPEDTTSHGKISLVINGTDISGCDDDSTDYGINQAAVQLLRSVFIDHKPSLEEPLIPHGCWIIGTCPNCVIDFSLVHAGDDNVMLSDFYVSGGRDNRNPRRYASQACVLPLAEYAAQVIEFAEKALRFLPAEKSGDQYDVDAYLSLCHSHKKLLELASEYSENGAVTNDMRKMARATGCSG